MFDPGRHSGDAPIQVKYLRRRLCGAHDDTGVPVETVHLGQDLIERLLALVASTSHPTACAGPRACNRIDFVDEDDAGRILLGLRPECDGQ